MDGIIAAAITGGLALIGVIITVVAGQRKMEESMRVSQAVTATKLEELTREVRKHNGFAERLPVVENDIKTIYKRLDKLEDSSGGNDGK